MAATPKYKVFTPAGEYEASVKHAEMAAALVAVLGDGAEVRLGHAKWQCVWAEGHEDFSAAESYDGAAEAMLQREADIRAEWQSKSGPCAPKPTSRRDIMRDLRARRGR